MYSYNTKIKSPELTILAALVSSKVEEINSIFKSYDVQFLLNLAVTHGFVGLIYQNLENHIISQNIQEKHVLEAYKVFNLFQIKVDFKTSIIDQNELDILEKLNIAQIEFVILKGFVLSHSLYEKSNLRPRTDIDIIIAESSHDNIKSIFKLNEYTNPLAWEPIHILSQFTMRKKLLNGLCVDFDVHFQISNSKKLSRILTFNELKNCSEIHSIQGKDYRFVSREHAFIHASFHLLQHLLEGNHFKAIWIYDLYLLLKSFSESEMKKVKSLVEEKKLQNIMIGALEIVNPFFPEHNSLILLRFSKALKPTKEFKYLLNPKNKISLIWSDLSEIEMISDKLGYLKEIVFPPVSEIRKKYPNSGNTPTFYLYLKRFFSGLLKYIRIN